MNWEPTGNRKRATIDGKKVTLLEYRSTYGVLAWCTEAPRERIEEPPRGFGR